MIASTGRTASRFVVTPQNEIGWMVLEWISRRFDGITAAEYVRKLVVGMKAPPSHGDGLYTWRIEDVEENDDR